MKLQLNRRNFLKTSALAASSFFIGSNLFSQSGPAAGDTFSFPLLGDVHIDNMVFHDTHWMSGIEAKRVKSYQAYDVMTRNMTPRLLSTIRQTISDLNRTAPARVPFVLQVGDLVDGYCGNPLLAQRQSQYGLEFIRRANLQTPFLFTKGNHDVAGKGARDAYKKVFLPYLTQQVRAGSPRSAELKTAYYSVEHGNSIFLFFDAYDRADSLDWMEKTLAKTKARHVFVVTHPPAIPYGSRPDWSLFTHESENAKRTRFLNLLGKHRAILLSGHLHKYNCMVRRTDTGKFLQLAVCSVIHKPEIAPPRVLSGLKDYTPTRISLHSDYSPEQRVACHKLIENEMPFVENFEFAALSGYAVVDVAKENVKIKIYSGFTRNLWKTIDATQLLAG